MLYKIPSKIITNRLTTSLSNDFSKNQFGFLPNKTASEASLNLSTIVNYAHKSTMPMQLISLDIDSAFDRVLPISVYQMMKIYGLHNKMIKWVQNLVDNGQAIITINKNRSRPINLRTGTGQGNVISAIFYLIAHELPLLLYKNILDQNDSFKFKIIIPEQLNFRTPVRKITADIIAYADDGTTATNLLQQQSLIDLYSTFNDLEAATGLTFNTNKTEILFLNTPLDIKEDITELEMGTTVQQLRHLGVYITDNPRTTREFNAQKAINAITPAINKIMHLKTDIYTKKTVDK